MKLLKMSSIAKLSFTLIFSIGILFSLTSITNARTASFTIHKGWNLIGGEFLLRSSDVLNKYPAFYYNPFDKTYHKVGDESDSSYQQYDKDYVSADALRSFWIYNDQKSLTVPVDYDNSMLRMAEIGMLKLKQGWNFLTIANSMYYDDNGQPNNLSPSKIKGTCQIEKAYIFNSAENNWVSWGLEASSFDDDTVGMGWVVKVASDCQLSVKADIPALPNIPSIPN